MQTCWYKGNCNKEIDNCEQECIRYKYMSILVEKSNLPPQLRKVNKLYPCPTEVESYQKLKQIKDDIYNFVKKGNHVYIYSTTCGNGKTTWASKLVLAYLDKVWSYGAVKTRALFVHTPMLLNQLKSQFLNEVSIEEYINAVKEADLVIFDDLGITKLTDYDLGNLLEIIDYRINTGKSNIYTGNLDEDGLIRIYGGRLASRIYNLSHCIELNGFDRRSNKKVGGLSDSITSFE